MKIVKNIPNIRAAVLSAAFICLMITGCKKEEDDPVTTPSTPQSPVGNWTCNEVSKRDGTASPFTVHIVNGTGDTLLIENFYALGFDKKARMKQNGSSFSLTPIPQQVGSVFVGAGSGSYSNASTIKMTYIIDDGNPIKDTVNATFTKQ